ncbi:MAG TPA: ATP-binding protein [Nitrospirae bacterium]|nr:ATPase family associated with various cellular activities [bacterium BMS3Bbin09]HDO22047.1 ATP-binding protein [Nitrospirota bacterium]HDO66665.1 ATP-binding protein [Nitrospirota bacterium]HEW80839.1 ATP-binding protein [Nitrospirota bacterium]
MFKRPIHKVLLKRLSEPRRFIQVLAGPRQTGKTTLARQVMSKINMESHYASADEPTLKDLSWIEQQWEAARTKSRKERRKRKSLLILDEIQKITNWPETVKRLWDDDTFNNLPLHVIILGSSQLLLHKGLTESLAGRFEIIPITHWSFGEMKEAFRWNTDQYIYFGGYPGAAELINDHHRWSRYIIDSLIETTISRDILLMARVDKPALLRRLFELTCSYSGQVLSYQKMLGQLQDAGNTTTLAHYLNLLEGAGLASGLQKYAGQRVRQKASSPKLQVLNTALMTAPSQRTYKDVKQDTEFWGRLVESAVGATLANGLKGKDANLFYWSGRNREVDFVLSKGKKLVAIEVKSGTRKASLPGIEAFSREFRINRKLLVGADGIKIEEFLLTPPEKWLE